MTIEEYTDLFRDAIDESRKLAEQRLGRRISHNYVIELYGPGCSGLRCGVREAVDRMYLGSELFYRLIDIAVIQLDNNSTTVFCRVSGHKPGTWDLTMHAKDGGGPFHLLQALDIVGADVDHD